MFVTSVFKLPSQFVTSSDTKPWKHDINVYIQANRKTITKPNDNLSYQGNDKLCNFQSPPLRKENPFWAENLNWVSVHRCLAQVLTFNIISGGMQCVSNSYSLPRISNSLKMDKISISQIFHSRKLEEKTTTTTTFKLKKKLELFPKFWFLSKGSIAHMAFVSSNHLV